MRYHRTMLRVGILVSSLVLACQPRTPRQQAPASTAGTPDEPAADLGTELTIGQLIAMRPESGRFTVEGYVQDVHHCPPCPKDAICKPCEETIWISSVWGAFKEPLSFDHDLLVHAPDATRFEMLGRYRITVDLSSHHVKDRPLPDLELRGYRRLD